MKMSRNYSLLYSFLFAFVLAACGGGETSTSTGTDIKQNSAPSITVSQNSIDLISGESATLTIKASDDNGEPTVAIQNASTNVRAELSADGKTLVVTANTVEKVETGTVTLVATENAPTKLQTTYPVTVRLTPKVELFALPEGQGRVKTLTARYAKPLIFRIVDSSNQEVPFTNVSASDPSIIAVQSTAGVVTVSALKTGESSLVVTVQLANGTQQKASLLINAIGNQQPTISIQPSTLTVEELQTASLTLNISDPDDSYFQSKNLTVSSADNAIATAVVKDGIITVSAVKAGSTTIKATIVDGEFTISASANITVTPEILPSIVLNNNNKIELEELKDISIPIDIKGNRSADYKASIKVESINGSLNDLRYNTSNNLVLISALESTYSGNTAEFKLTASATNGRNTITAPSVSLYVSKRVNGVPIFEFPNKFNNNIMVPRDGSTKMVVKVNDDFPTSVSLFSPESWYNESKNGTFTFAYDDATRTLTVNLSGFEKNEKFGLFLSYKDRDLGGKFGLNFRTYDFTPIDMEIIDARKIAIAKIEAARSYQLIARMFAEHLENIGLVDYQYVDELLDQMKVDDTKNTRVTTAEFYISLALENVFNNDFNTGTASATSIKEFLSSYALDAQELNRTSIDIINGLAAKSDGYFPTLSFENTVKHVSNYHFSKFVGNATYGSMVNGKWEYSQRYKFLSAIDAKVNENTVYRLNTF